MDAVSLRGYWEMCFKLQCWFLRLTARKFSLLLTNASQSINGWTRKTCFSPIKQPNMCLGWFVVSSTCFPSFGSTAPKHFGRQCKGREGRKDVCFLMTLAWKWHTVLPWPPISKSYYRPRQSHGQLGNGVPGWTATSGSTSVPLREEGGFWQAASLSPPNTSWATFKNSPPRRTENANA